MYLSITLSFSEKWAYSHLSYTMLSRKILGRMSCPRFDDDYRRYESKKDYDMIVNGRVGVIGGLVARMLRCGNLVSRVH